MRLLHTSDWHLGRLFHGVHLTEEQAHVLDQIVRVAVEARPDVVLVSGDVFDRAVPPPDAVSLLDDVLSRLVLQAHVPVVLIAGNHDSGQRLSFGARLLAGQGLHVVGTLAAAWRPIVLRDDAGPVSIYTLPYTEPAVARQELGGELADHDAAMAALLGELRRRNEPCRRAVLMAHALVLGGEPSDSERPLTVSGGGAVDVGRFAGFSYVALGHLHQPQRIDPALRYSGSLLKYSFSEAGQTKSVALVELDATGGSRVETIALAPRRDVRCVEGTLLQVLAGPQSGESREDYVKVTVRDDGPILDLAGKVRQVYPNVLAVERPPLITPRGALHPAADPRQKSDLELFAAFFGEVTGRALSPDEVAAYQEAVDSLRRADREAGV
jgi:DNA repair protein SbcD/Mre11